MSVSGIEQINVPSDIGLSYFEPTDLDNAPEELLARIRYPLFASAIVHGKRVNLCYLVPDGLQSDDPFLLADDGYSLISDIGDRTFSIMPLIITDEMMTALNQELDEAQNDLDQY